MREATIADLGFILDLMGDEGFLMRVRNDILMKSNKWIIGEDIALLYEPIGNDKWIVHIYSHGGKEARDFAVRASRYMIDMYGAKVFLNFVSRDRMDLRFFMRMIGSKKVGQIGDEILYMSTEHMGIKEN